MSGIHDEIQNTEIVCNFSSKTDAVTININNDKKFSLFKNYITGLYSFHENINKNGIETCVFINSRKTVISIYQNKTIFVQGKGSVDWTRSVFDPFVVSIMSADGKSTDSLLANSQNLTQQSHNLCEDDELSHSTPLNSPKSILSQMINRLRSPSGKILKRTPAKLNSYATNSNTANVSFDEFQYTGKSLDKPSETKMPTELESVCSGNMSLCTDHPNHDDDDVTMLKQVVQTKSFSTGKPKKSSKKGKKITKLKMSQNQSLANTILIKQIHMIIQKKTKSYKIQ